MLKPPADDPATTACAPEPTANENRQPTAYMVPIVGHVGDDGRVVLNGAWTARAFPNDHREA